MLSVKRWACLVAVLLASVAGAVSVSAQEEPECPVGSTFVPAHPPVVPGDAPIGTTGFCGVECPGTEFMLVVRTYHEDGSFTDTGRECPPDPPAVEPTDVVEAAPPVVATPASTG